MLGSNFFEIIRFNFQNFRLFCEILWNSMWIQDNFFILKFPSWFLRKLTKNLNLFRFSINHFLTGMWNYLAVIYFIFLKINGVFLVAGMLFSSFSFYNWFVNTDNRFKFYLLYSEPLEWDRLRGLSPYDRISLDLRRPAETINSVLRS